MAEPLYYAVIVPETGEPVCEPFETLQPLVARLREIVGQRSHAFVFHGRRLPLLGGEVFRLLDGDSEHFLEDRVLPTVVDDGRLFRSAVSLDQLDWLALLADAHPAPADEAAAPSAEEPPTDEGGFSDDEGLFSMEEFGARLHDPDPNAN